MNDETAPERPYRFIGKPLPRKEDERLVTGAGRFTDMAHAIRRQQHMRTGEHRAAAGPGEPHIVFGLWHRIVRNRRQTFGGAIDAGEDAEHAWHGFCRRDIDRSDARMRMR